MVSSYLSGLLAVVLLSCHGGKAVQVRASCEVVTAPIPPPPPVENVCPRARPFKFKLKSKAKCR